MAPAARLEIREILSEASPKTIEQLLRYCQASANKNLCIAMGIADDRRESAFKEGQKDPREEIAEDIVREGASFGLSPRMQKDLCEYFKNCPVSAGGATGENTRAKEKERLHRHAAYEIDKVLSNIRAELEGDTRRAARPTAAGYGGGIRNMFSPRPAQEIE